MIGETRSPNSTQQAVRDVYETDLSLTLTTGKTFHICTPYSVWSPIVEKQDDDHQWYDGDVGMTFKGHCDAARELFAAAGATLAAMIIISSA